eukprot:TRINITY_DN75810_c0_g1_i2.p1 TRINITY_DN75810_c0_g1~~TRINITY_DN75810_c0_g1_i2.p1  ORF type:complete len:230 (+),score=27.33 TRINITY_DN75810_c0_g1_i2:150-839(+)
MVLLREDLLLMMVMTHALLGVFAFCFALYTWYLAAYFARIFFRSAIRLEMASCDKHKTWALTEPELKRLFTAIEKLDPATSKRGGLVQVERFADWLITILRFLRTRHSRQKVHRIVSAVFDHESHFGYPEFKFRIAKLISSLVVELNTKPGDIDRESETVSGSFDRATVDVAAASTVSDDDDEASEDRVTLQDALQHLDASPEDEKLRFEDGAVVRGAMTPDVRLRRSL